jgi:Zn-finger nucleic acid-binding protein
MNCPRRDGVLETHALETVQVDECPVCRGIWFDEGELDKAKDAADPDLRWMEIELCKDQDRFSLSLSELECPRDGAPMVSIIYDGSGVVVDHCVRCKGVWLDQGEFQRILAALEQEMVSKPGSEYLKESLDEAGEIVAGPKGFASEWRDFMTVTRLMQYRLLSENPKLRDALVAFARSTPFK